MQRIILSHVNFLSHHYNVSASSTKTAYYCQQRRPLCAVRLDPRVDGATVEFQRREAPAFIPPDIWPASTQPYRLLHLGPCTASCISEAGESCGSTEAAHDRGLVWRAADRCR